MNWYSVGKQCVALRKHNMRVDMRVYCGEAADFTNPNDLSSAIKAIITSAIMKGVDVIGVVSAVGPQIGWAALKYAKGTKMDMFVLPGEEYECADKAHIVVYLLKEPMPKGLELEQAVTHAHQQGGFVMLMRLTRRQAQQLDKIKGTPAAPNAVEIWSEDYSGYLDSHLDASYTCFISSGAKSAADLEQSTAFTTISREDIEALGILPKDEGEDYQPKYLERDDQLQQGADEAQVAGGHFDAPAPMQVPVPAPGLA